jgi:hypothetical protein
MQFLLLSSDEHLWIGCFQLAALYLPLKALRKVSKLRMQQFLQPQRAAA